MNERQTELARQLVASKHWRFTDGAITACGLRVCEGGKGYVIGYRAAPTRDGGGWYDGDDAGLIPDLDDPATIGCLLALVREAWGDGTIYCVRGRLSGGGYMYAGFSDGPVFKEVYCTEGEALAAALLGAP
jgi:hypothetical protein